MNERVQTTAPKVKPMPIPTSPFFDLPKVAMPNFDMPKMEIPAAFREFTENGVSQARATYEGMQSAAETATHLFEQTYATSTKGLSDYGRKVIEATRVNTNSIFNFYTELMTVKSFTELVELTATHGRKQFETLTAQSKDLAAHLQKVTTETAEPISESVTKAFKKAA